MSTWTNEFDVFRDLDRLSGLGRSNVTYPSLNAFGRGKLIIKEDRNGRKTRVAQFSPPPKIPVPQSCLEEQPSKMQDETTWERDRDLYLQLREICGRGYSNELIEEEFGQTECHSQEQLNGISCDTGVEDLLEEASNKLILSDKEHTTLTLSKSASSQLQASNTELVLPGAKHSRPRLFVHPPKLKPSRNALLNSLARRKILQLSDEPEMTDPPITCHERGTGCFAEDVIPSDKCPPGAKLLKTEFVNGFSDSVTEDKLAIPDVASQKMEVESAEICDQGQSYRESQKQCINWSDIRKLKVPSNSPVSMYSCGSPSSPVHAVNSYTSQMSRQNSKVKSIAAPNVFDLPGLSASPDFLREERDTSRWKQGYQKKQDLSRKASGAQFKSGTKRTKEYWCSLPSSPTNFTTPKENLSWSSLRKHNSHPKQIMLSDYIKPMCSLGSVPTHSFSESSSPHEELRDCNSLQIHSAKDFPPLE
ncbi:uncharacterized protein LOC126176515 [Schistocerca cancellata]|uniref:uncharacterized protein LOC126176515 n=1 Tax=Schistocerca cancellata TaxID=274614 RepID=UPI002118CAC7|nr:uncharacterized protein LOC126176515 [Schistocerca cancellata]